MYYILPHVSTQKDHDILNFQSKWNLILSISLRIARLVSRIAKILKEITKQLKKNCEEP